ncbi:MAG: ATP-binding protein [Sulfurospirillum sp.]|nr:ATP-binding protein [Sulfurospirillum sp.]
MNELIRTIKIKKYKCFNNLEANNLQRVNLISGKNNVGKTAFIEACSLVASSKRAENFLFRLTMIEKSRDRLNMQSFGDANVIEALQSYKKISLESIRTIEYEIDEDSFNPTIKIKIDNLFSKIGINDKITFQDSKNNIFIDNFGFKNRELKEVYDSVQFKDKNTQVDSFLKNFGFKNPKFKIIGNKPYLKIDDDNDYNQINKYGDGVKHYISIICSLYACKDGYLFIDEIENGIHYALYDELWKIIFQLSKEQSVQVFATTHSKECIESYSKISQKIDDSSAAYVELGRDKQNNIKANVMSLEQLNRNLTIGNGVRGW